MRCANRVLTILEFALSRLIGQVIRRSCADKDAIDGLRIDD